MQTDDHKGIIKRSEKTAEQTCYHLEQNYCSNETSESLTEFPDAFDGMGGATWVIYYKHKHQNTISLPPTTNSLSKFKAELDSLMKQGIISPVMKPTPCVNSFVCFLDE